MHKSVVGEQLSRAARRLLRDELDHLIDVSTDQLLSLEPNYKPIGEKTLADQMRKNISLTLLRIAGDEIPEDLAIAAYETGQLRAIQQVDLLAVSRSFRIDLRVLWEALLEDAERQGIADNSAYIAELLRVWEAVEANINEMTEGYRVTSEKLKQQDNELKIAAFQRLLTVGASGNLAAVAKQLSTLSFDPAAPLTCVVSDIRESDYGGLSILQARLAQRGISNYFGWQNEYLVGILQGPDLTSERVIGALGELRDFRTGIASVAQPTSLFDAIRNARVMVAAVDRPGLHVLRDHWLDAIAHAEPTLVDALVEQIFAPFAELSEYVREELTRVLDGFFSTNGTIVEIAAAIYRHRNTVRNRLAQIEELTGLRLAVPRDIALLALAFPAWKRERTGQHTPQAATAG